jgi:hypothetical protein
MNIYSGTPYTYYISWSALDLHYYGVRFANHCHPNDFWKKYFTSSDKVKSIRKQYGDPDIIKIRRTFNSVDQARLWESRVLKKLKVLKDNRWLNANVGKAYSWKSGVEHQNYGRVFSQEARQKQSISKSKLRWWNNGIEQSFSELPHDASYKQGRLPFNNVGAQLGANISKFKKWYTNGVSSVFTIPGTEPVDYIPGRKIKNRTKPNPLKGAAWWTNGKESKLSFVSPGLDWTQGRTT